MKYQLKEHVWSWTNTYDIKHGNGELAYQVVGKFLSWGNNLSFKDALGNEVASIQQRLLSFLPTYNLDRNGQPFAEIKKKFTWLNAQFELDVPGPNDYTIDGSFWEYEYRFERGGRTVARVSKEFWSWSDTYGVEIVEGEDDVSILATMIVIDLCCHEKKNNN